MEKRKVLFVDDDVQYLRLLISIVTDVGFDSCRASSAEEALALLATKRFEMMVTDLQMPGMDGLELSTLAKRLDPDMEIVLVTGAVSPEVLVRAATIGISTVLAKPCRVEEIKALVQEGAGASIPAAPTGSGAWRLGRCC